MRINKKKKIICKKCQIIDSTMPGAKINYPGYCQMCQNMMDFVNYSTAFSGENTSDYFKNYFKKYYEYKINNVKNDIFAENKKYNALVLLSGGGQRLYTIYSKKYI